MKLSVIKQGAVIVAVAPNEEGVHGRSRDRHAAPFTGIAPLPGQKLFSVEVPEEVAHRLFAADSSEAASKLFRSYKLTPVKPAIVPPKAPSRKK